MTQPNKGTVEEQVSAVLAALRRHSTARAKAGKPTEVVEGTINSVFQRHYPQDHSEQEE